MHPNFDVPGLPDGTITIPQPATCPELADLYNAPLCAFDHELHLIPMQITLKLADSGGEGLWWLIPVAVLILSAGAALFIGAFIRAASKRASSRTDPMSSRTKSTRR